MGQGVNMPVIPLKMSERSSMVGAPDRSFSDVKANAAMFGGGIGEAAGEAARAFAGAVGSGVEIYQRDQEKERSQKVALDAAQTDLLTPSLEARKNAPADGSGVKATAWEAQRKIVEDHIAEHYVGDAKGADAYRRQMLPQMASIRNSNVQFEFQQKETYDKTQADNGLNAIYNRVRVDPSLHEDAIRQGHTLIDNSNAIPAADKAVAKTVFGQKLAATTIEGQLNAAKTIDEVKTIQAQLTAEGTPEKPNPWQRDMAPEDFKRITLAAETQKRTLQTKVMSAAKTELSVLRTITDDPTAPPIPPERMEGIRRTIESAGSETDTVAMNDFARLQRDEQLKATTRGLPAYQIASLANASKGGVGQAYPNLPPEMSDNINKVTRMFPGVSAGYLGATATIEYGGQFRKDGKTNYGVKSETSSATGVYQFIDATWDEVTSNPGVQAVLKANGYTNITRDLRADPLASTIAAAALASQNKSILTSALHRDVSDAELYMAHFMGAEGASKFLTSYVTNRDASAAALNPAAAEANKSIYYTKEGRARTVAQVYDLFTTKFVASPSQVAYGDAQTYGKIFKGAAQAQTENPIKYASTHGTHVVTPLDQPGAFEARGSTFKDVGTYFRIPDADNKPFDADTEVPQLKKTLQDGSPEQVAQLLASIGSMDKTGPGASTAALKQLGEKDTAYGVAAQLMQGDTPNMAAATSIIRGQKIINAGTTIPSMGDAKDAPDAFGKVTGTALSTLDPTTREAIFAAAKAHYAEVSKTGTGKFDAKLFDKSVHAVMGGTEGNERIGVVNSVSTILPRGVPENVFEKAVDNLKPQDLISASVNRKGQPNGMAPVYSDGTMVKANDIANQGRLRYVGADTYQVQMPDNKFLVTKEIDPASGAPQPYRIKLDKNNVQEIANRERPGAYAGIGGIAP
jgi:hypothetical protein